MKGKKDTGTELFYKLEGLYYALVGSLIDPIQVPSGFGLQYPIELPSGQEFPDLLIDEGEYESKPERILRERIRYAESDLIEFLDFHKEMYKTNLNISETCNCQNSSTLRIHTHRFLSYAQDYTSFVSQHIETYNKKAFLKHLTCPPGNMSARNFKNVKFNQEATELGAQVEIASIRQSLDKFKASPVFPENPNICTAMIATEEDDLDAYGLLYELTKNKLEEYGLER